MNKWDQRFTALAAHIAQWSKDESTQVGCVLARGKKLVTVGYNGPPAGVDDDVVGNRPKRLRRSLHAEANAILTAGRDTNCTTAYVTHHPCSQCCAMLVQAGVVRVVCPAPSGEFAERWKEDIDEAKAMFAEAGVKLEYVGED